MNLNKVFIAGRLTADPQLRSTAAGQQVTSFSLATNRVWTDKNNQKQEAVEFHNIVVWGRQAEVVSRYLTKGALALVEGRLQTRSWEDKNKQQRKTTEIIAERVQFGPKPIGAGGGGRGETVQQRQSTSDIPTIDVSDGEVTEEIKAEDLPF